MKLGGNSMLLVLLALFTLGGKSSPGGQPAPARGPYVRLTLDELKLLAEKVGFVGDAIDMAAMIAMRESGGNPQAQAIVTSPRPGFLPERSFGLWQINVLAHPQYSETRLLEPEYNGRAAFEISKGGSDWSAWRTS